MSVRLERIKELIANSDMTYQELEKVTGIKKSSLQRYATGETTKIPLDVIEKLSDAFNVSKTYLMGWDEEKNSPDELQLTEEEKLMIAVFRLIPEGQRRMFLDMGRVFVSNLEKDPSCTEQPKKGSYSPE